MHIFFELLSNILCLIMKKTSYVYPLGKTDGYCRVWGEQTQRHGLFTMGIFSIHEDQKYVGMKVKKHKCLGGNMVTHVILLSKQILLRSFRQSFEHPTWTSKPRYMDRWHIYLQYPQALNYTSRSVNYLKSHHQNKAFWERYLQGYSAMIVSDG